jgi:hypothetical protein
MPTTRTLFRDDGTPCYVTYNDAKPYRPGNISVMVTREGKRIFQKTVSAGAGNDVGEIWLKAADIWMTALGLSKRSNEGKAARTQFIDALEPFLKRYKVKTATKRVFE